MATMQDKSQRGQKSRSQSLVLLYHVVLHREHHWANSLLSGWSVVFPHRDGTQWAGLLYLTSHPNSIREKGQSDAQTWNQIRATWSKTPTHYHECVKPIMPLSLKSACGQQVQRTECMAGGIKVCVSLASHQEVVEDYFSWSAMPCEPTLLQGTDKWNNRVRRTIECHCIDQYPVFNRNHFNEITFSIIMTGDKGFHWHSRDWNY